VDLPELVARLDQLGIEPIKGLPDDLFYFVSRTTPLVNVDLLIKDERGRNLLAWRHDQYAGKGWHVPGGIIRFKETFEERLLQVGLTELGTRVTFEPRPLAVNQIISESREIRGHFISILYRCFVPDDFQLVESDSDQNSPGDLTWYDGCPDHLLEPQKIYREYL